MSYSKHDIESAVRIGQMKGATHTLIVCDSFDHEDYSVHVMPGEDIHAAIHKYSSNMQTVMEVYNLTIPLEPQLEARRSFNI